MRCLVLLLITFAVAKSFPLKNEDTQQETESDERDAEKVRYPPYYDESDQENRWPPIVKRNQETLVEDMIETPMNDPAPYYYGGGGNFGSYGGGSFGGINAPYGGGGNFNVNSNQYGQGIYATPVPANNPYGGWGGGSVGNQIGSNLGGGYGGYYYGKRMIAKPATDPGFIGGGGGGGGGGGK